jgi:hypothetical protein
MRREVGTWDAAPVAPARTPRPERPVIEPIVDLPPDGEEAEVEIVQLGPAPQRDDRRPISKLSDRLNRVAGNGAEGATGEPVISMRADFEEASVEIEAQDPDASKPGGRDDSAPSH